jgi:hypothetical protein
MAVLNDIFRTDLVDDVKAAISSTDSYTGYNTLISSALYASFRNVETITATKTLTDNDMPIQLITANSGNQIVKLATEAVTNHVTWIACATSSSDSVLVENASTTDLLETLTAGQSALCLSNGAFWDTQAFGASASLALNDLSDVTITSASDGQVLTYSASDSAWTNQAASGGTSLTYSNISPTSDAVSAVENYVYNATIAGLTTDINFEVPAPSAAGKTIRLNILDGDADYVVSVVGAAGVNVNGSSDAWSTLFIADESVTLESSATDNWQVIQDGRIPCSTQLSSTDAQTIATNTNTKVTLNASNADNCSAGDTTNYRILTRRTGLYNVTMNLRLTDFGGAGPCSGWLYTNETSIFLFDENSVASGRGPSVMISGQVELTAGDYQYFYVYQNSGGNEDTYFTSVPNLLNITEVLK